MVEKFVLPLAELAGLSYQPRLEEEKAEEHKAESIPQTILQHGIFGLINRRQQRTNIPGYLLLPQEDPEITEEQLENQRQESIQRQQQIRRQPHTDFPIEQPPEHIRNQEDVANWQQLRQRIQQQDEIIREQRNQDRIEQEIHNLHNQPGVVRPEEEQKVISDITSQYLAFLQPSQLKIIKDVGKSIIASYGHNVIVNPEGIQLDPLTPEQKQEIIDFDRNQPEIRDICRRYIWFDKRGNLQSMVLCSDGQNDFSNVKKK